MIRNAEELATLEAQDWVAGVQMKVEMGIIKPNPLRNLEDNPIDDARKKAIIGSVKATAMTNTVEDGMWRTLEGGIVGAPDVSGIKMDGDMITEFPSDICIPFGHHRYAAAKDLKFKYLVLTVRIIDMDTMYRMLANENYNYDNSNFLVRAETVKQGTQMLEGYMNEFTTYKELNERHPSAFASEKAWKNAKAQGIGKGALYHYLGGDPWNETEVSYILRMLKNIEGGVFSLKDINRLSSIGVINALGTMLTSLQSEKSWPDYTKARMSKAIVKRVNDPNNIPTVKSLREARDMMMNQNFNPVKLLASPMQMEQFDLDKEIRTVVNAVVKQCEEEKTEFDVSMVIDKGFSGFEKEIMEALKPKTEEQAVEDAVVDSAEAQADDALADVELPAMPGAEEIAQFTEEEVDTSEPGEIDDTANAKAFIEAAIDVEMLAGRLCHATTIDWSSEVGAAVLKSAKGVYSALQEFYGSIADQPAKAEGEGNEKAASTLE